STPRAPARALPTDQEGFRGLCSKRPVPGDGGTCQARRPPQGALLAPQRLQTAPTAPRPSGPVRGPRKGNNAQENSAIGHWDAALPQACPASRPGGGPPVSSQSRSAQALASAAS